MIPVDERPRQAFSLHLEENEAHCYVPWPLDILFSCIQSVATKIFIILFQLFSIYSSSANAAPLNDEIQRSENSPALKIEIQRSENNSDLNEAIRQLVLHSTLFKNVVNKQGAIDLILDAAARPECSLKVNTLCTILENHPLNWSHPIFQDPDFFHLVVISHIQGRITDYQIATLFARSYTTARYASDEAKEALRRKGLPVDEPFTEILIDANDARVRELLYQTLIPHNISEKRPFLDEEQFSALLKKMEELPPSERRFMLGEIYNDGQEILESDPTLYQYSTGFKAHPEPLRPDIVNLTRMTNVNIFNMVHHNGKLMRIYPSAGMALLMAEALGNKVPPTFCIGAGDSAWEGLSRVISMPSPYQDLPKEPDGFFAYPDQFMLHDFFHLFQSSPVPPEHRQFIFTLCHILTLSSNYKTHPKILDCFTDAFKDMDTFRYLNIRYNLRNLHNKTTYEEELDLAFWNHYRVSLKLAVMKLRTKLLQEHDARFSHLPSLEREKLALKHVQFPSDFTQHPDIPHLVEAHVEALSSLFQDEENQPPVTLRNFHNVAYFNLQYDRQEITKDKLPKNYLHPMTRLAKTLAKVK